MTIALLVTVAIVLGLLLLPVVLMTLAMPSRGAVAVVAGILGVTFLLLIGAVGWVGVFRYRTVEVAESRTTGVEFGPPGEDRSAPNPPPVPIATAEQSSPPAWAYQRAARVDGEYLVPIRVGPYTTPLECEQSLLSAVHQAVDEYVALYLGEEARGRVRLPRAFIEDRLIRERWYENRPFLVTSTEQAEMTFLHVLLVFDGETNDYLQSLWRSAVSLYRVGVFTAAFAGVLWLLAVAWSYLKLDQISAGRYRGRLRAAAAIAVILPPLLLALLLGFGESLGFGEMPALVLSFAAGV